MAVRILFILLVTVAFACCNAEPVSDQSCRYVVNNNYHVQTLQQNAGWLKNTTVQDGGVAEDLKSQVAALQSKIQTLEQTVQTMTSSVSGFYISFCEPESGKSHFSNIIHLQSSLRKASWDAWPNAGDCQAVSVSDPADVGPYTVTVDVMISRSINTNIGHIGVMYNVIDEYNYDILLANSHNPLICWQQLYMKNGGQTHVKYGSCSNGPPKRFAWLNVKIEVSAVHAKVYYNNGHVITLANHFPMIRRGGFLVINADGALGLFKNYKLQNN